MAAAACLPAFLQVAHDQLLQVCMELQQRGASATPSLLAALHLVHCYLLVRTLVRQGDHMSAARLLLRVADGIDAFPKHAVAILTSTVIECHRAQLHANAQVPKVSHAECHQWGWLGGSV